MKTKILLLVICASQMVMHAAATDSLFTTSLHFQQTVVSQYHTPMKSPYSGFNSLEDVEDWQTSLTGTLFLGIRLWDGGAVYFNPEIAGGSGLSSASGIAGFSNGECFRVGSAAPAAYVARLFIRHHFELGSEKETVDDGVNVVSSLRATKRITLTLGKFCLADIFDQNSYSHDARSQFLNWSLMDAGAWDYPANTRGYTTSFVAEYVSPELSVRAATSMVPAVANGPDLDGNFSQAHSETLELEKPYSIGLNNGIARVLLFTTTAHMGNYREVLENPVGTDTSIIMTRRYGRTKRGIALNIEQQISNHFGAFLRASWNDGRNETWAFTEIDHSLSAGVVLQGDMWGRHSDKIGIAGVGNGISADHRDYLAAGGYGFIIGDGRLNYGNEIIAEVQYICSLSKNVTVTPDYQYVLNPAYNRDRGPVHVVGIRVHSEF